ncbi:NACHT domain-containing protein [Kitasatospora sp. NPDC059795]|uniref:NACHT domain-containing protein n=1 Tax=Kitasatospora sp. NPDC059795 TaxID=3346949 RepID=UPI0036669FC6
MSVIATAAGVLGKVVAKPLTDAAMRQERVLRALKAVRLDPRKPPRDFDGIYAYALIEYCADRAESVLAVFRDQYVIDSFRRSFEARDLARVRREVAEAVERNRETGEFGHLAHGFEEHVDAFAATFEQVVDRTRAPHEVRFEEMVKKFVRTADRTRDEEEGRRLRIEPGRAELTPAQRLAQDAEEWFRAVRYDVLRKWSVGEDAVALRVDIPNFRGRIPIVMLCVADELGPHHLNTLAELVDSTKAQEGWGIARLRVSAAARAMAAADGSRMYCYSFDELIDLEADFEPYLAWVEEEVRRRGIDTRYVPQSCEKSEIDPASGQPIATSRYHWQDGGLDDFVARWLDDPTKQHLSVLGEFGMGKSWFALHLAYTMVQAWRDAKRRGVPRPRLPLLIPLRDYVKQTRVEGLLAEFFFDKHQVNLRSAEVVRVLNRMGRLLLIFDGFDEMAARADRNTVVANFWSLASAVDQGAKVLLSSRKEHFRDDREARDLFGAKISTAGHGVTTGGPTFEIVQLVEFDDEQIERMLRCRLPKDKAREIMEHPALRGLMRRPLMSELVIEALPEIEQGAEIDLARIYLYAVCRKMDRDIHAERTFTSRADKVYFLCEVAWEMLSTERLVLNYRDFPGRLRSFFGPVVQRDADLDFWEHDMRNQGMLVRNAEGDYGPSHKSLLEFLVALKFAGELGLLTGDFLDAVRVPGAAEDNDSRSWSQHFGARGADGSLPGLAAFVPEPVGVLAETFGAQMLNETVLDLLATMVREHPDHRARLLELARASSPGRPVLNCLHLLAAADGNLVDAPLAGLDLTEFEARRVNGRPLSLAGADLRGANLAEALLFGADLAGADLTGALLSPTVLWTAGLWSCLLTPDGALAACNSRTALHWPDGLLSEPPLRFEIPRSLTVHEWSEAAWWLSDFAGGQLVDSRSGRPMNDVEYPDTLLVPLRWRGRRLLMDPTDGRIYDPENGRVVEDSTIPVEANGWVILAGHFRVGLLALGPQVSYVVADSDAVGGWRTVAVVELGDDSDRIIQVGSGHCHLLVLDGRPVMAVDGVAEQTLVSPDGLPLTVDPDSVLDGFVFRAAVGQAVLAQGGRLTAWSMAADGRVPIWERAIGSRADGIWADPAGERLAAVTHLGELWLLDFRTGEVLHQVALTDRLRGARFSRDCGFDEDTLAAIVRLGGVIVD